MSYESCSRAKLTGTTLRKSPRTTIALLCLTIGASAASAADTAVPSNNTGSSTSQIAPMKRPVTPETLLSLGSAPISVGSNLSWIPGTNSVLVPVKESDEEGTWTEEIDVTTGQRKRLVKSGSVAPSPNGTKIAYISGQSGNDQIWMMSRDGGNAKQVTNAPEGLANKYFCWSPDSSRIAYMASPPNVPEPPRDAVPTTKEVSTVVIYNRRESAPKESAAPQPQIWTVSVQTGDCRKIAACLGEPAGVPSWSPDGKTVFSSQIVRNHIEEIAISLTDGECHAVIAPAVADTSTYTPSPNGKDIAFQYCDYHGGYWHNWQIAIASLQGGQIRHLPTPFKTAPLGWTRDGKHLFISRRNGVDDQIVSMDTEGRLGKTVIQMDGTYMMGLVPVASTDGRLAWVETDWQGRMLLQTASEEAPQPRTVVNFTPEVDSLSLGEAQTIDWTSHDGVENSGVLIKPVGYSAGKKYPLIVDIHGGPAGGVAGSGVLCIGALEWQMWANKGYAVLVPEFRSSGIYGFDKILQERRSRKYFDGDFDDIMSGVDHLIATGLVDSKKMAVVGHSYGSIATNWIITHTHRFQAAVSYEGVADLYSEWGTNEFARPNLEWLFNGTPLSVPQAYLYNSALYRASDASTPTLFITAEHGSNSPSMVSMYASLKSHGVDTQYLFYRGEGHVVSSPANKRDLVYWCVNWIDTHLGFSSTPDPKKIFDVSAVTPTPDRMTMQ